MKTGTRLLAATFGLALASAFFLPASADAGSSHRRNYANEWEREEREEERREERERAREEWMEHQKEQSERYLKHRERQLDKSMDRIGLPDPDAPPPRKKGGTCIYGADNKVLHQPDGVTCDH